MSSKYDRGFIVETAIVWVVVGISVVAMVMYAGITGVVFSFVVLVVGVTSWSRIIRSKEESHSIGQASDVSKSIEELSEQMQLLNERIKELEKELQE
ncbi:hypothetical protein [Caldivirga maquilingensis]|uniref:Uncharacterized protein n=1 Tax=Caldivirga maquilingensis (strain ATCC 700844 / DSM 13496 / JCM 10307 / IC-167) TaxID=397948 RepID=A8M994_CALMQ|nr:hypothetical protein [Caldivirga maquilingensis]ABW02313.1 hypothetical protein Cmaq_1489 [Caldivirga maquilingensis IC-167]